MQACRLVEVVYSHADDVDYRDAVTGLIVACKAAFLMRMDLPIITSVVQEPTETCQAYLARLTVAFDLHSGMTRGQIGAVPFLPYEVHLIQHFMTWLRLEIAAAVRQRCVFWKTAPL